mgnify:CR=1 FL=1
MDTTMSVWGPGLAISLLAAMIPAVLYVLLVRWLDRYEKEPGALLAGAFLWGSVPAVLLSLIAEVSLGLPLSAVGCGQLCDLAQATAIAPVVEEVVKGLALLGLCLFFRAEFDGTLDGVIYGALVGFGFAMTENLLYFIGSLAESGLNGLAATIVLRSGAFGMTHAFFTGVTGAGFGYAREKSMASWRWAAPPLALGLAIGLHSLHNLGISVTAVQPWGLFVTALNYVVGFLLIAGIVVWSLSKEKRWIANELAGEVGLTITRGEYNLITRKRYLAARRAGALVCVGGRRVYLMAELNRLATELALKKHQLRSGDDSAAISEAISRLRAQIGELRRIAAETIGAFVDV